MQKFGILAATAMTSGVDAYRMNSINNTPFTGEHADAQSIEGESRSTHRLTPVADTINKYDSIISKFDREPYKPPQTRLYEKIFGEAPEEKPQRKKRLGAQTATITNSKEDLFTMTFIMGGKQ